MSDASTASLAREIKLLREDLSEVRYALIPPIKVSKSTLAQIRKARAEMESGVEKHFSQIL